MKLQIFIDNRKQKTKLFIKFVGKLDNHLYSSQKIEQIAISTLQFNKNDVTL